MAKEIQIAPTRSEVIVSDNSISTTWGSKPRYNAELKALRSKYGDDAIAEAFSMAIALSSYDWQVCDVLNDYFKLHGTIDHAK